MSLTVDIFGNIHCKFQIWEEDESLLEGQIWAVGWLWKDWSFVSCQKLLDRQHRLYGIGVIAKRNRLFFCQSAGRLFCTASSKYHRMFRQNS
jgi:hypothetical protein